MTFDEGDASSLLSSSILGVTLLLTYAAALWVRPMLPARHRDESARTTTHAVLGLLVTLIGILLGMMVSTAKSSFDTVGQEISSYAIQIEELDHLLGEYGPTAAATRADLKAFTGSLVANLEGSPAGRAARQAQLNSIETAIRSLHPEARLQRVQLDALVRMDQLLRSERLVQSNANIPVSIPFFVIIALWAAAAFFVLGLVSAWSTIVFTALCCAAFAISSAVFVLLDMSTPLGGLIAVSTQPLRAALETLGG